MASSVVDALRVIKRLDGATLYGSRVRVSFSIRDTRDSFWRRRWENLTTLDPPLGTDVADSGTMRTTEGRVERPRRSVEGVVDDEKFSVLQTCAIGWVKETWPIKVLAQEMATVGLQGFELVWIVRSMLLLSFSVVELCDSVLAATEVWSAWFSRLEAWTPAVRHELLRAWLSISCLPIHLWSEGTFRNIAGIWGSYLRVDVATEEPSRVLIITSFPGWIDEVMQVMVQDYAYSIVIQEAELVRIPAVEHPEEESDTEVGDESRGASVASAGGSDVREANPRGFASMASQLFMGLRSMGRMGMH
ncbi:hypothetical protein V6N11_036999 [Hibiscus sabdariffa]|uniref:DUF4283 domain-containing protein n=1 Tax=Hibiscus sabdariffa TaxID=183260 RepID=A0ABR2RCT2_9ROSI